MGVFRHILILLTVMVLSLSCGQKEGKVIPRGKLAEIYADMFVTDQWILDNPEVRRIADTSLVYEPIFEKYGYTSNDYRKTVDVYLDDPERFSRILRKTADILDGRLEVLKKRRAELEHEMAMEKWFRQVKIESDINIDEFFPYLSSEPYVHYYDSLAVEPDSVLMVYRFRNIDRADTVYRDLRMIVSDSLATADTLAVADSIAEHTAVE